jgi:hypothetical protein
MHELISHAISDARYFTSDALLLSQCDGLLVEASGEASKAYGGSKALSKASNKAYEGSKTLSKASKASKAYGGMLLSAMASLCFLCRASCFILLHALHVMLHLLN